MGITLAAVSVILAGCTLSSDDSPAPVNSVAASDMSARAEYLASLAKSAGIVDPPDVALVRFVSAQEWAAVQIDCLADAGFEVSLLADGQGIDTSSLPDAQTVKGGPFQLAQYTCEAMYTIDAAAAAGLDDDQLAVLYDWYVSESVPCLEHQGLAVAAAPSKPTFIQTYFTSEGWYPYASVDVMGMDDDQWNALNASCPQSPPDELLYG